MLLSSVEITVKFSYADGQWMETIDEIVSKSWTDLVERATERISVM